MILKIKETGKEFDLTLRHLEGSNWSPDFFYDLEPELRDGDVISQERFNEIVNYWNKIVDDANNGLENEKLIPAKNDDYIYDFDYSEID